MTDERMADYQRIIGAIRGCDFNISSFCRSFEILKEAKEAIFDTPQRLQHFLELLNLDTDKTVTGLKAEYNKYLTAYNWIRSNMP